MKIHGISGLSLLDYPGYMACTVFTGNCNFRCPFCHNAGLVLNPDSEPLIPEEKIFELLENRRGKLEGVAITGGEPTLNSDLEEFCGKIKELRFKVKLDTNGSRPEVIKKLCEAGKIDYIAMDIKACPENYAKAAGLKNFDMEPIFESVDYIMNAGNAGMLGYEFRTTVVGGIHTENDFIKIGKWLKGAKAYFLQSYRTAGDRINDEGLYTFDFQTMEHFKELLLPAIPNTSLRGIT